MFVVRIISRLYRNIFSIQVEKCLSTASNIILCSTQKQNTEQAHRRIILFLCGFVCVLVNQLSDKLKWPKQRNNQTNGATVIEAHRKCSINAGRCFQYSLIFVIEGENVTVIIPCLFDHIMTFENAKRSKLTLFDGISVSKYCAQFIKNALNFYCYNLSTILRFFVWTLRLHKCTNNSAICNIVYYEFVYFLIHFYRERSLNILKCNANDHIFDKALLLSKSFHVHVIGNKVFR